MKTGKRSNHNKKQNKTGMIRYNHEIIGILFLALGVLALFSFYFENSTGIFGRIIRSLFLGLFGAPAFILPPVLIVYSFLVIFKKELSLVNKRVVYSAILLLLASAFLQTAYYDDQQFRNLGIFSSIGKLFEDGRSMKGGGVFGGLVSMPFLTIFKTLGTIIILTALAVIDVILLTNMSVANFIRGLKRVFVKSYKASRKITDSRKKTEGLADIEDEGPVIVGDNEDLKLEFKPRPKVIDFRIEKTSRELKENIGMIPEEKVEKPEDETEFEVENLVIKDIKDASPQRKTEERASVTPAAEKPLPLENVEITERAVGEYRYPPFELLEADQNGGSNLKAYKTAAAEGARRLEETLASFGVAAKVINVSRGPSVTRYELQPSVGVKVSKIVNLADDISLNLASAGVRIEAPIPGKAAIGIEVPNREVTSVYIRDVLESPEFAKCPSKLSVALGKDISGQNIIADIAKMPHLLIAGATGSGKSVCVNNLIVSILYKASPEEVKLLMVDPKVVELGIYNGIPHLLIPVVTDPRKAAGALNWAVQEMINRYKLFADKGARDISSYNKILKQSGEPGTLPQIVIIIDELADLMMAAPNEVEDAICRLAQMARAAGMHLVIATQRPSVDVITGVIKANIPSRISFAVSSQVDSRTILDMAGAEKLLGKGDMLFYPIGTPKPVRVQGAYVSDREIEKVVEYVKNQAAAEYDNNIIEEINSENEVEENEPGDNDELLPRAIELVVDAGQASVSLIQRKFKVGYARAARIVDQMEARGIVGGFEGSKPRQVLISRQQLQEMQMADKKQA